MTTAFCMPLHGSAGLFRPPLNEIVNHSGSACQRKHAELTMGEFLTYTYRANKHVLLAFGSDRIYGQRRCRNKPGGGQFVCSRRFIRACEASRD